MARQKLSKIASELNVGLSTVREFLQKKNIEVEEGVNARVDETVCELLVKEFGGGKEINLGPRSAKTAAAPAAEETPAAPAEPAAVKPQAPASPAKTDKGPKVLGKIDLATGKPIASKPQGSPKPEPKPSKKSENSENSEPSESPEETLH